MSVHRQETRLELLIKEELASIESGIVVTIGRLKGAEKLADDLRLHLQGLEHRRDALRLYLRAREGGEVASVNHELCELMDRLGQEEEIHF